MYHTSGDSRFMYTCLTHSQLSTILGDCGATANGNFTAFILRDESKDNFDKYNLNLLLVKKTYSWIWFSPKSFLVWMVPFFFVSMCVSIEIFIHWLLLKPVIWVLSIIQNLIPIFKIWKLKFFKQLFATNKIS